MRRMDSMQFCRHELVIVMLSDRQSLQLVCPLSWTKQSWVSCCELILDMGQSCLGHLFKRITCSADRLWIWVCLLRFYCCREPTMATTMFSHFMCFPVLLSSICVDMLDGLMLCSISFQSLSCWSHCIDTEPSAIAQQNNIIVCIICFAAAGLVCLVLGTEEDPIVYLPYIHPLVNTDLSNQQLFYETIGTLVWKTSVYFEDLGNTCFILKQGQEGLIRYTTLSRYKSGVISNPGYYRLKSSSGSGARGSKNLQRIKTNNIPCG